MGFRTVSELPTIFVSPLELRSTGGPSLQMRKVLNPDNPKPVLRRTAQSLNFKALSPSP